MSFIQKFNKPIVKKVGNYLFIGLLLLLVFNPAAKAWLLRQFMNVGLFKAGMKKEAVVNQNQAPAQHFVFRDVNGVASSTAELEGKVVFINFWATWCPPCVAEMPGMNAMYKQLRGDERFVFLFINEDEDPEKAKEFLQKKGFAMPLFTRAGNAPAGIYSGTLPTTVVLDKTGKVVFKHEGFANYNNSEFIAQLKALL